MPWLTTWIVRPENSWCRRLSPRATKNGYTCVQMSHLHGRMTDIAAAAWPRQSAFGSGSVSVTAGVPFTALPASTKLISVPSQSRSPVAIATNVLDALLL